MLTRLWGVWSALHGGRGWPSCLSCNQGLSKRAWRSGRGTAPADPPGMVTRTGQWQSPWGPTRTRGRGREAGHEQQKGRDGCVRSPRRGRPRSSKEKTKVPRGSPAAQAALGSAFRASVSRRLSLGDHLSLASLSCSSSRVRHEHCTQRSLRGVKQESGGGLGRAEDPWLPDRPLFSPCELPFPLGPDPSLYTAH